jgi:hypothetical protein
MLDLRRVMSQHSKARWFLGYLCGTVLSVPELYLLLHYVFKIRSSDLLEPLGVFAGVFSLLSLPLFWAKERALDGKHGQRPIYVAVTMYFAVFIILSYYYGARLGLMVRSYALGAATVMLCLCPLMGWAAYSRAEKKRGADSGNSSAQDRL